MAGSEFATAIIPNSNAIMSSLKFVGLNFNIFQNQGHGNYSFLSASLHCSGLWGCVIVHILDIHGPPPS